MRVFSSPTSTASTRTLTSSSRLASLSPLRYSVCLLRYSGCLLYWYKSVNSDEPVKACISLATEVLSLLALLVQNTNSDASAPRLFSLLSSSAASSRWTRQRRRAPRYSIYSLYWYKSTNTDAKGAARSSSSTRRHPPTSQCSLATRKSLPNSGPLRRGRR